jgi:hypothetical protein
MVVEEITPARAAQLLAGSIGNRHLRPAVWRAYARDMKAGRWVLNGTAVILNGTRLIDGHHRCRGCVAAEVPFPTVVVYDADPAIHFSIDRGVKRSIGDELRWRGEVEVNLLGAGLSLLWRYQNGALQAAQLSPTVSEQIELLEVSPELRQSVRIAARVHRAIPVLASPFAVVDFLIRTKHGAELADRFAELTASGANLNRDDPVLVLRTYALNVAASRMTRPRREEWLAVLNKAANAWLLGRPVKSLRWRRVGAHAESFPRLIEADEL